MVFANNSHQEKIASQHQTGAVPALHTYEILFLMYSVTSVSRSHMSVFGTLEVSLSPLQLLGSDWEQERETR